MTTIPTTTRLTTEFISTEGKVTSMLTTTSSGELYRMSQKKLKLPIFSQPVNELAKSLLSAAIRSLSKIPLSECDADK